jgi:amino acid adenylation domain-containing protein
VTGRFALTAEQEATLEQMLRADGFDPVGPAPIPRVRDRRHLPLSFTQERLWFLAQLAPGSPAYHDHAALELIGPLQVEALERGLAEIVRRHEALRTTFRSIDGQPVQVVGEPRTMPLCVHDLRALPESRRIAEARRVAVVEARRPFDLEQGPLLRWSLLRLGAGEHVLLLAAHHLVSDGWSMGIFLRELAALYAAFIEGRPSPLPDVPIQYGDFAAWQRRELGEPELRRLLAYWRQELQGAVGSPSLTADLPAPEGSLDRGRTCCVELPGGLVAALRELSRREGATPFMTLLAAYQATLARCGGQGRVLVGSPVAGRSRMELDGLIGCFVNTIVLGADLTGDPSFRSLLAQVRERCRSAYAHQDLPFERLVEDLHPDRGAERTPLFQTVFVLHDVALADVRFPGLRIAPLAVDAGTARFDLSTAVTDVDGRLECRLTYRADLFERATIERLADRYRRLLESVIADPDRRLSSAPLLDEAERRRLLAQAEGPSGDFRLHRCVHTLFEEQVARTPDRTALVCGERAVTYRELDALTNGVAARLRALGIGPEARVAICMERSVELVSAILGVLKAGGAYVPLDPGHPDRRLGLLVRDSGAQALVADRSNCSRFRDEPLATVVLDASPQVAAPADPSRVEGRPANLAYVIYTSGSTGQPKGVMVAHRSVVNLVAALADAAYPKGEEALRIGLNGPFSFDTSVKQWTQLLRGHTVHVLPDEVRRDARQLVAYVRRHRLDVLDCTPSQLRTLLDVGLLDPAEHAPTRLLVGGESIDADLWHRIARAGGERVRNVYGPTECTVDATAFPVIGERPVIGRPLANVSALVLDAGLDLAPAGVPGELCIAGEGVARGYLGLPGLTAARFVPDPFAARPGGRLYRTGDRARWLQDGTIEFLGRVDAQLKVRGVRIEPGEIEAALARHPLVRHAVVVARPDVNGGRLVAHLAAAGPISTGELRTFARGLLPEPMVPTDFVTHEALPLTAHGKVNRRALAAIAPSPARLTPPRTAVEDTLAAIWAEVLDVDGVGIHDAFFDLGGHSLLATRALARVNDAFGVDLPLRTLFDAPTVAGFAAVVESARHSPVHAVHIRADVEEVEL